MPAKITQKDVDEMAESHGLEPPQGTEPPTALTTTKGPIVPSARSSEAVGVSGEADPSDFVLPFIRIVQRMSTDGKPGTYLTSTGTETDHIDFVILHIARTRTFYDGDAKDLLCSSRDRAVGTPRTRFLADELGVEVGTPVVCRSCPHYQDDQFQKLACKFDYLLTVYDLKAEEPFLFRARGASLKMWRARLSPILAGQQPPWFAAFEMTVKTAASKAGHTWYEPDVKLIQRHAAEERAAWASYAEPYGATAHDEPDADDLPFE